MQVYGLVGQTEEGIWPEAWVRFAIPVNWFKLQLQVIDRT